MSLNIIIVDDAAFIREALSQICIEAGNVVVAQARNGNEAVDFARKYRPDVIILDMVLPEKNGIEVTKEILQEYPFIKIIACSTVDQKFVIKEALQAGCSSYLQKPFSKKTVIEALNLVLNRNKHLGGSNV